MRRRTTTEDYGTLERDQDKYEEEQLLGLRDPQILFIIELELVIRKR